MQLSDFRKELYLGVMDIPQVLTLNLNVQVLKLDSADPDNTDLGITTHDLYDTAVMDAVADYNTIEPVCLYEHEDLQFSTGTLSWASNNTLRSLIKRLAVLFLIDKIVYLQLHNKVTHNDNISTNENDKAQEWHGVRKSNYMVLRQSISNYKKRADMSAW